MEPTKKPHGGARKGAGRKTEKPGESMDHATVTLDEMTRRKLTVLGDGNLSKGVRLAADVAYDRYQQGR